MAKKEHDFISLFERFIRDTASGKRLKSSGERIKPETIKTYKVGLNLINRFVAQTDFKLRILEYNRLNKLERTAEAKYWKKFERCFTHYLLHQRKVFDNYISFIYKLIKAFFNYVNNDRLILTGPYYKQFKFVKQEIPVAALSKTDLLKLIYDKTFEQQLPSHLQRAKDMFVFGCICALRYSDLMLLRQFNFEKTDNDWYLKIISKKTLAKQTIKLPSYGVDILQHYLQMNDRFLFPRLALVNFNYYLKKIGEQMQLTHLVTKERSRLGVINFKKPNLVRFCDTMSSHLMRKTAITTMLTNGMPENLVKHISGHVGDSKSFHRYVAYSQTYVTTELDRFYEKMSKPD